MSTVRVAKRLNLRTIAEHVHSEGVHARLRELGVDHLQGDLFGKPGPIAALFAKAALLAPSAAPDAVPERPAADDTPATDEPRATAEP